MYNMPVILEQKNMKDFIAFIRERGILGLAIGFILGKAVSDLVASLVGDIINPVIGIGLGRFKDLSLLSVQVASATISYGKFISLLINFILVALIVYIIFKKLLKVEIK